MVAKPLPKHVKDYLAAQGVAESDVPDSAKDTLADLSPAEVAVLKKVGDSLVTAGAKPDVIALVH